MSNVGSAFGLICPNFNLSIDIRGSAGSDPEICPECGTKMVANKKAKVFTNVTCKKCGSSFGIINRDTCPACNTPF